MIAAALAVELCVTILQHSQGYVYRIRGRPFYTALMIILFNIIITFLY
ncbi:unnamed protein product [Protopolystoma xenopodis]|uniref:Uncharacterized protein n=1 Tax=Protopolystoma xenopodis TaxID=117903 RepID=A0A3S5CK82_9PLAT|nr:unnamed protein product [Protopolystoma xenopodis]